MGPKIKFTKEQIVEVAFEIAREEGLESITIRKVANRLGSSVAPVYVNFTDGNELLEAVIHKTQDIAIAMTQENYTELPFLNMGIGNLRFAREYSVLFKSFTFMKIDCLRENIPTQGIMLEQMKKDSTLQGFSDDELAQLLLKMSIFTHGLTSMTANQMLPEQFDEEALIGLLRVTGEEMIMAARMKKEGNFHANHNR